MTKWKSQKKDYGKVLEEQIVLTNQRYKDLNIALIDKVPTPWNVSYRKDKWTGRVKSSAFPEKKSTVDFTGVAEGFSIAFDVKSTREETRFDLKNIQEHQYEYLKNHEKHGGISFFIVEFSTLDETYFLDMESIYAWWYQWKHGGRASIPYGYFLCNLKQIKAGKGVRLDYWDILKSYILSKKDEMN